MMWSLFHDDLMLKKFTFYRELHQFAIDTVPDYLVDALMFGSVIQEIILSTNSILGKENGKGCSGCIKLGLFI